MQQPALCTYVSMRVCGFRLTGPQLATLYLNGVPAYSRQGQAEGSAVSISTRPVQGSGCFGSVALCVMCLRVSRVAPLEMLLKTATQLKASSSHGAELEADDYNKWHQDKGTV